MGDETKRPRDEEFQPEVKRTASQKQEPDAFEKNKQKPLAILAIIAAGIVFAVGAIAIYQVAEQKQHTIINVLPTDIADTKEKETQVTPQESAPESEPQETSQEETSEETAASEEIRVDDIVYRIQDGCAILVHCDSQVDSIQIPKTVQGYPVTEVADGAFNGCRTLYYLSLPEGVTTIGTYALANIGQINELCLPSTLKTLGDHALDYTSVKVFISPAGCYVVQICTAMGFTWEEGTKLPFTH